MSRPIPGPPILRYRRQPLGKHDFKSLLRRLSKAGFKKTFLRPAIFPDWWSEDCANDQSALADVEFRVARFLGVPIDVVRDPSKPLAPHFAFEAKLRRVRGINSDRLGPAIYSATQIASAVVRSLAGNISEASLPPSNGFEWREGLLQESNATISLQLLLEDLWDRGIPVIPIEELPSPGFQAMACIAEGRPVVLLGHKYEEPGRAAFLIAHEVGHIAAGDCEPGSPVVDEDEQFRDDSEMEVRADRFATQIVLGLETPPEISATNFKDLARTAIALERETGAEASAIIYSWARGTGDYGMATMAVKALYRATGARRAVRGALAEYLDFSNANESDRALLRCVYDNADQHEDLD